MNELVNLLESELAAILKDELKAGNVVSKVDRVWPRPGSICVQLKHKFKVPHRLDGATVKYFEDNDPHGPIAEYVHMNSGNSLLSSLFGS